MQLRTSKGSSQGGTSKFLQVCVPDGSPVAARPKLDTLVPTGSRLPAEGPEVGVQGFVSLLGNETPLSLTLEIGLPLSKQEEAKCRPLSQASAPFPPTVGVVEGRMRMPF